jgi:EAL domain-containing protein (putative c-di-GMP-specific phosphodiesterase class I)
MQQLSRIPFTELKIDRSFVCGAHRRKSIRTILESAVELAQRLQLTTVAEGVDGVDDWRLLQSFGCTQGQGWLIAPAMSGPELQAWAATSQEQLRPLQALAYQTP